MTPVGASVPPLTTANPSSRCPPLNLEFLWKLYNQRKLLKFQADNSRATAWEEERLKELERQGFPLGLASLLLSHCNDHPIRIWLVGNGGTMHQNDGHIVNQSAKGKVEIVDCSRWQEVSSTLEWHAELAAWCQTPMAIRFLQDPGLQAGPQQLGVSASKHLSSTEEVARLKTVLHKTRPTGGTSPIHEHLQEILPSILSFLPTLERKRKRMVLCICTDSIPTNKNAKEDPEVLEEFLLTLGHIMECPVQILFRLSTDEERVMQFYQNLMEHYGLSKIQVLDDYVHESTLVQEHNPWLNYGYPLHLCRETGIRKEVVEKLSREQLAPDELLETIRLIFGQKHPQDRVKYSTFRAQVAVWNSQAGMMWNPIKKKFVPWVDLKKMDKFYKGHLQKDDGAGKACSIM